MFKTAAAFAAIVLVTAQPASAHPGDHSHFDFARLAEHLLEPDHLVFLTLLILVGVLAFRAGRRAQARGRNKP